MIPVDITNREEAYEWLLRHGYSVDVANEELKNWEAQTVPAYDEDGEEYEEEVEIMVEESVFEEDEVCEYCECDPCECEEEYYDEDEEEETEEDEEEETEEEYYDDDDDSLPSDVER